MIRTFACLTSVLAFTACYVQPAPTTPMVVSAGDPATTSAPDDDGVLDSGSLAAGASVECDGGRTCNWDCPEGGCAIACSGGSTCNLACSGGGCALDCSGGAVCNFACSGGGCTHDCSGGAVCNFDD